MSKNVSFQMQENGTLRFCSSFSHFCCINTIVSDFVKLKVLFNFSNGYKTYQLVILH